MSEEKTCDPIEAEYGYCCYEHEVLAARRRWYQAPVDGQCNLPPYTVKERREYEAAGLAFCQGHRELLPVGKFREVGRTYCRDCHSDRITARSFSMTPYEYADFREDRNYCCDICLEQWQPGTTMFAIDHDHSCAAPKPLVSCQNCVRGFLCGDCNRLGFAWYEKKGRALGQHPTLERYLRTVERNRKPCEFAKTGE